MTEHFTERAETALLRASDEARELHHSYVGTEHILLALLRDDEGGAASVLKAGGVTHPQVQMAVLRMIGRGAGAADDDEPTFTGLAQDAVEFARRAASAAGREQADTEHILLALVEQRDGAAVRILLQIDVDPATIRLALSS